MGIKKEIKILTWIIVVFLLVYFLPVQSSRFNTAVYATLDLAKWYAREHVILCLLPAFFIAGVISVFVSQGSVHKYFDANAKKWLAYSVAAVSGTILAVCSCTILPLFSSIHKKGAGLGPAIAFLYSGPAINILAIILTNRVLGLELGVARTIGAAAFSVIIGSIMAIIYRSEEEIKKEEQMNVTPPPEKRPVWQTAFHFLTLVLILVFANWGKRVNGETNTIWYFIWANKWYITAFFGLFLTYSMIFILSLKWQFVLSGAIAVAITGFLSSNPMIPMIVGAAALSIITLLDKSDEDNKEWTMSACSFAKQILPLLASGMGKGPALALLLAGPSLSLPSMLVISKVIGIQKTIVYVT